MESADESERIDLDALGLTGGDAVSLELPVSPGTIALGGQEYRPDRSDSPARLDVSRTTTGYALRLRFGLSVNGPCVRCLEPATDRIEVDAREVDQPVDAATVGLPGHQPGSGGDEPDEEDASSAELASPYVETGGLDLASWARDALILSLPVQILCREDCLGLCSVCGESLNGADPGTHDHGQNLDPRWAKLRELR